MRIGVIGYSGKPFDKERAINMIRDAFDLLEQGNPGEEFIAVSGLTDLGIPALAYREAVKRGWSTIGIACSRAKDDPCFPCDNIIIVGDNWGDESEMFISNIDVLVRVGGGAQSMKENKMAVDKGIMTIEYELPVTQGV